MADKFCKMYQRDFGMKALTVKWFSVYGPAQKHYGVRKAVPTFVVAALQNKPLEIYGNGRQHADFIYVTDTVKATIDLSETENAYGRTFEIGSGFGTSPVKLAKMIIKIANSKSKIKYIPMRKGEDPNTKVVADLSEIRKVIKFNPLVGLQEGMEQTIAYYRDLLASAS
jgi:nucleoside-diphosphate-sugar epimerase